MKDMMNFGTNQKEIVNEVIKKGFKPFKTTIKIDNKTIHFMGKIDTHEIWILVKKDSGLFLGYNSQRRTEDCIGDKTSFLKACFGAALTVYMARQNHMFACMGKEGSLASVHEDVDSFLH